MLRGSLAFLVALVLLAPGAGAFANAHEKVALAYDATKAPTVLTLGRLDAAGVLHGGLLAASMNESRLERIPLLTLASGSANGTSPTLTNVTNATLVIHSGAVLWRFDNASASLNASAEYAFGFALPQSPFDAAGAPRSPAIVIVGPRVEAAISWIRGEVVLIPIEANVTVLDGEGRPVPGWTERPLNPHTDLRSTDNARPGGESAILTAAGAFDAHLVGQAFAGGLGASGQTMRIGVSASPDDLFLDTAGVLGNATRLMGGKGGEPGSGAGGGAISGDTLANFAGVSPILNGAILVLNAPGGAGGGKNGSASSAPIEAKLGDRSLDAAPFALMRSQDLALAWGDGQVSVTGTSAMTLTKAGVSTTAPLTVGLLPLVSVILWLGAIASIVFFFVKRPPPSKGKWSLRLVSLGVYALAFVLVAWYWDRSFAQTFGTSILTTVRAHGISGTPYSQLALVFGLEAIPWTLSAILFAIPVRIMLGIALRYRGEGSSFKRVASAGGLVSLAVFGPLYALWIVNVLAQQIVGRLAGSG